jgi:hypothetical protein
MAACETEHAGEKVRALLMPVAELGRDAWTADALNTPGSAPEAFPKMVLLGLAG